MKHMEKCIYLKKLTLYALCSLSMTAQLYAIQPISEEHLAVATGDQNPIQFIHQAEQKLDEAEKLLLEDHLDDLATHLNLKKKQYDYDTLQRSIRLNYDIWGHQKNALLQRTHENAESLLGLEGVSMVWRTHDVISMADLEKVSEMSFNRDTGSYEVKNIRGQVYTVTELR